jgi:hypothetical protein
MNGPAGAGTFSALAAAARQHRASTRQVILLTVRFIAERARAVLPDAAAVGVRWSSEGSWLELAGFFTADGAEITGKRFGNAWLCSCPPPSQPRQRQ